jgi:F-box protein 11
MNDLVRQTLCDLVGRYGRPLCADAHRCEALLRDFCGEYRREVFVLLSALREQVVADLLGSGDSRPPRGEAAFARLAQRLHDHLGIVEEAARWAVDSWALALGLVRPADLHAPLAAAPPAGLTIRQTVVVSPQGQGNFRKIGDALRQAPPGTRIVVRPGFYRESLVLSQPVEIVGDGSAADIVLTSDHGSCLRMQTAEALVRGLTIAFRADRAEQRYAAVDLSQGRLVLEECDVTSNALSCVLIHGPTANAVLRRCHVHHGNECGVYVLRGGEAVLESCDVERNRLSGVQVKQASLVMTRCRIHDQPTNHGLAVLDNGQATVEDCDVFGNGLAGISVSQGSRPVVRRTQIHDGKEAGVLFHDHGQGTVEDCDIFGNAAAGVVIRQGSTPTVRRCRIHDQANHYGVYVSEKGRGRLEECDLFANRYAGLGVRQEGRPTVRACKIHHHARHNGVFVYENGQAVLEECDVADNAYAGVEVCQGGRAEVRRCRVRANGTVAVRVWQEGGAVVEGCDLADNAIGPWNVDAGCRVAANDNRE